MPVAGVDARSEAIVRAAPAVEGERGADHAPVAQGQQVGHAPLLGLQNQLDRVRPVGGGFPGGVRLAGAGLPQGLARGVPLRVGSYGT